MAPDPPAKKRRASSPPTNAQIRAAIAAVDRANRAARDSGRADWLSEYQPGGSVARAAAALDALVTRLSPERRERLRRARPALAKQAAPREASPARRRVFDLDAWDTLHRALVAGAVGKRRIEREAAFERALRASLEEEARELFDDDRERAANWVERKVLAATRAGARFLVGWQKAKEVPDAPKWLQNALAAHAQLRGHGPTATTDVLMGAILKRTAEDVRRERLHARRAAATRAAQLAAAAPRHATSLRAFLAPAFAGSPGALVSSRELQRRLRCDREYLEALVGRGIELGVLRRHASGRRPGPPSPLYELLAGGA